ncbi:MAG: hypothetical protein WC799_12090 [Desulfobacteraceae bacterium]|jgi:hypothetical protein
MNRTLARVGIAAICLLIVLTFCLTLGKLSAEEKQKERLVLLPVQGENLPQTELDLFQDAIKEGFSNTYEIFSGEQVQAKLQKFTVNSCTSDECLEKIAIAFNGHLVGRVFVDRDGKDTFLRIQIKDVYTDKDVYTKTSGCTGCSKTEIMQKLIALTGGGSASSSAIEIGVEIGVGRNWGRRNWGRPLKARVKRKNTSLIQIKKFFCLTHNIHDLTPFDTCIRTCYFII